MTAIDALHRADDNELLADLLGGPRQRRQRLARQLLHRTGSLRNVARAGGGNLRSLGVADSEARRLLAAFELGRRALLAPVARGPIRTPDEAFSCVAPELVGQDRERFVVVVLDVRNRPRCVVAVGDGGVDQCPVDVREVFLPALRERGSALLVAHNHPSGDPEPSAEDLVLTRRLADGGKLLGLPLLDHLVVAGPDCFVSLAERGLLPA